MGRRLWSIIYGGASHQRGLSDSRHREVGKDVSAGAASHSIDAGVAERTRQTPIDRNKIYLCWTSRGEMSGVAAKVKRDSCECRAKTCLCRAIKSWVNTERPCGQTRLSLSESQFFLSSLAAGRHWGHSNTSGRFFLSKRRGGGTRFAQQASGRETLPNANLVAATQGHNREVPEIGARNSLLPWITPKRWAQNPVVRQNLPRQGKRFGL
jgi:hypothetical protein